MKVALVSSVYPPRLGGPATQTRDIAHALAARGEHPFVVTFGLSNGLYHDGPVPVHTLAAHEVPWVGPALQYANAMRRLDRILREERPDVVHVQTGVDPLCVLASGLLRRRDLPGVVKFAGDLIWERLVSSAPAATWQSLRYHELVESRGRARLLRAAQRYAFRGFTRIWATSRFQRDAMIRHYDVDPAKIHLMPNYVELKAAPVPRRQRGGPLVLATVARFARWKRLDLTLSAFAQLGDLDVRLRIAGGENDPLAAELHAHARALGVEDRVDFLGSLRGDALRDLLDTSHLFVSSTEYEPFGIVFVEAMARGLPVVATETGGIPDVVRHGETGLLVPPRDTRAMAMAMRTLALDDDAREQMAGRAAKHASSFSLRENIGELILLYEAAIGGKDGKLQG